MIPVITGATRTISISFRKHLSNVLGKHEVKQLQKTAIPGTAHTLPKVCFRYVHVNTLHKGDDNENNNKATNLPTP